VSEHEDKRHDEAPTHCCPYPFRCVQSGGPFPFDPTASPHYVWHCHVSEHEDNDMMRPLIVMPEPLAELSNRNGTRETALPPPIATFP